MLLPLPLTLSERQRAPPGWGVWEEAPLGLVFSLQQRGTTVPKEWEFGMPKGAERDGGVVVRELGTGLVVGATGSRDEIMDSRWNRQRRQEWPSSHPEPLGLGGKTSPAPGGSGDSRVWAEPKSLLLPFI